VAGLVRRWALRWQADPRETSRKRATVAEVATADDQARRDLASQASQQPGLSPSERSLSSRSRGRITRGRTPKIADVIEKNLKTGDTVEYEVVEGRPVKVTKKKM
jgi:hypothetical protein